MAAKVRFYLDENVQVAVAEQLRRRQIEVITVRDLDLLGENDQNHLSRATSMSYVLCTHDPDYVELAQQAQEHARIILGQQHKHTIGDWVAFLELVHTIYDADDMQNVVEYLKIL